MEETITTDRQRHQLGRLAKRIRTYYVSCRVRLTGYQGKPENMESQLLRTWAGSFWEKLALSMIRYEADPERWIDAQFHRYYPKYPFPNQLSGQKALTVYQQYNGPQMALDAANANVNWCYGVVKTALESGMTLQEALNDPLRPLNNPLFCYCLAYSEGLYDVASAFKDAARTYLEDYPVYGQSTLGRYIPKELV